MHYRLVVLLHLFLLATLTGGCAVHHPEEKTAPPSVAQKALPSEADVPSERAARPEAAAQPEAAMKPESPPADLFEGEVRPMLARNCSPCHVPGGRMYGRLPFDSAEVVLSNKDAILGRLKTPEDRLTLEKWVKFATQSPKGS